MELNRKLAVIWVSEIWLDEKKVKILELLSKSNHLFERDASNATSSAKMLKAKQNQCLLILFAQQLASKSKLYQTTKTGIRRIFFAHSYYFI